MYFEIRFDENRCGSGPGAKARVISVCIVTWQLLPCRLNS